MKKYIISVFIPYLLFYLSGCYSMQRVTKEEFSPAPDYPELYLKTKVKEYTFEEGNYTFANDTIYGKGELKLLVNPYVPFEGKISIKDVEKIEMDKVISDTANLIVKTSEKEFIFKNDVSTYSIKNDTIYGIGKYKLSKSVDQFVGAVNINESEKIYFNQYNPGATIALVSGLVLGVALIVVIIGNLKLDISDEDVWRSMDRNLP